jgi:hypothetical protein
MQANDQIVPRRRPTLRLFSPTLSVIAGLILLTLAVAWSFFWFFAAHETEKLLAAWMAREKSVDRIWTCPDQQTHGYPFKIEISCAKASFSGEVFDKQLVGSLHGVRVAASLLHPDRVEAFMEPPFDLRSVANDGEVDLQWDELRVDLDGLPQDPASISINGANVSLRGGLKGFGVLAGHASGVNSVISAVPDHREDKVYAFHIAMENVSVPAIDTFLGGAPSDAIKLDGSVAKADFLVPGKIGERLDHWRLAGGSIDFSEAMLVRRPTVISARGTLQLDDQHRPQGQLDAQFSGAEPLLRRFGINPALIGAGSLLTSLFGGKSNYAPQDSAASLRLPVTLRGGFISVGPVKTNFVVPPLY